MSAGLGVFRAGAHPDQVRACLLAFYALLDGAERLRSELGPDVDLRERLAAAAVVSDLHQAIASARLWLSHRSRRGVPAGAGRSPADKGQGWPALDSSGRTRVEAVTSGGVAVPADVLSCGLSGQQLPEGRHVDRVPGLEGGHSNG